MKRKLGLLFAMSLCTMVFAQNFTEWNNLNPEQRKEVIKKMTPEEREKVFFTLRENAVMSDLNIPKEKKEEFKNLFQEYQNKQKEIKVKFVPRSDYDKMSEEEARKQLKTSFEVGQQLLDNRKHYAERMQQVVPPQQVLKMFENEGKVRGQMMQKMPSRPTGMMKNNRGEGMRGAPQQGPRR